MSGSDGILKHLAFFEELAQLEEADPEWNSVTAGLVVLRLVDAWIEEGPRTVTTDSWGVRGVRAAIEEVTDRTPLRHLLGNIVDALDNAHTRDLRTAAPRLIAYGQALEFEARWSLACDVYRTVIAHTHPIEDGDIAIMAHLRLAHCLWNMNEMPEASTVYERAGQIASTAGDMIGILRARIGEAQIAVRRGNLPKAEQILDETIARADDVALQDVRSRALHDRSTIAHQKGEFDLAIRLAYDALECSTSFRERDRILGDIAGSFVQLGVLSAARDAYLVLAATAQEQFVRWAATINLMDIAARELAQPLFERFRRELESETLPPHMATAFELNVGEGYDLMGHTEDARIYLERARDRAQEYGFAQLLFVAEEHLAQIDRARRVSTHAIVEMPESLFGIASKLRELREETVLAG